MDNEKQTSFIIDNNSNESDLIPESEKYSTKENDVKVKNSKDKAIDLFIVIKFQEKLFSFFVFSVYSFNLIVKSI